MSFRDTNMLADTCPRCQKRLGFVFGLRGLGWRQRGHEGRCLRRSLRNGETQETSQTTAAPLAQEATAQIADQGAIGSVALARIAPVSLDAAAFDAAPSTVPARPTPTAAQEKSLLHDAIASEKSLMQLIPLIIDAADTPVASLAPTPVSRGGNDGFNTIAASCSDDSQVVASDAKSEDLACNAMLVEQQDDMLEPNFAVVARADGLDLGSKTIEGLTTQHAVASDDDQQLREDDIAQEAADGERWQKGVFQEKASVADAQVQMQKRRQRAGRKNRQRRRRVEDLSVAGC